FKSASSGQWGYLHNDGANAIVGWRASATASNWYIVPATTADITLATAGEASYATAYLPFGISKVDGAKAYVGTLNEDKTALNMTEVSAAPAQTGLVLVGAKGAEKATVTIATAAAEDNKVTSALSGTLTDVALTADNRANNLVFGKAAEVVGFYTPGEGLASIPANKAFLNAADAAQAVALHFGGEATGIGQATLTGEGVQAPVYDLSGRRVVKAVKGGVYIQGGRKFIVK
ncbi:MAG: hypothetical protein Q4P78_08900, partial [Rothia sp. (in: high G+C Gram-positive bacteria)]|uniref:hypothetical protein n=1 Tax=Rothia sp. (in: high G+C Gram-positive bacteria) TaxID=1885016 RepID=UPI0026E11096